MTRVLGLLACLLVLACAAAPAQAQDGDTVAPPGNSAIDEYLETVPGADGNRRVDRRRTNGLSPAERRALERLGEDGELAADVLGASVSSDPAVRRKARERAASGGGDDAGGVAATAESLNADDGKSGIAALVDGVLSGGSGDGPGMGALLPLLLLGSLVVFVGLRAARGVSARRGRA